MGDKVGHFWSLRSTYSGYSRGYRWKKRPSNRRARSLIRPIGPFGERPLHPSTTAGLSLRSTRRARYFGNSQKALFVPSTPGLPAALILMVRVSTEEKFKV
jgi:hypothetical protein